MIYFLVGYLLGKRENGEKSWYTNVEGGKEETVWTETREKDEDGTGQTGFNACYHEDRHHEDRQSEL